MERRSNPLGRRRICPLFLQFIPLFLLERMEQNHKICYLATPAQIIMSSGEELSVKLLPWSGVGGSVDGLLVLLKMTM